MIKRLLKYYFTGSCKIAAVGSLYFFLGISCYGQTEKRPQIIPQPLRQEKYNEYFSSDSLHQIGSVILNTKTNQIYQFCQIDTNFYPGLYNQKTGRWLSTDPLFKSYPYASPYHYANNRPTSCIDVEGQAGADVNGGTDPPVFTLALFGRLSFNNKSVNFALGAGAQVSYGRFVAAFNVTSAGKAQGASVNTFCTVNGMASVGAGYNFRRTSFNLFANGNKSGSFAADDKFLKDGMLPGNDIKEIAPDIFPGLHPTLTPPTQTLDKALQDKFNGTQGAAENIAGTAANNSTVLYDSDQPGSMQLDPLTNQNVATTIEQKVSNNIATVNQDPSGAYTGMPGVFIAINGNQGQTNTTETQENTDEAQQQRNKAAVLDAMLQNFIKANPVRLNLNGK